MELKLMKKPSSLAKPLLWRIAFINVGIFATILSLATMTSPAVAQTTVPRADTPGTGTTTTYDRNTDYSGLWGLAGLAGLFGLLGRRKEQDLPSSRRDNTPVYRDPNVR
jgi:MYXO-CTERM domain-containing protein